MPASIFDKSSMSLINCSSNVLLLSMILIYSCFSCSSSAVARMFEKPMIAFSGVRISWLILARKADFSRLDSSARSLAESSSSSIFFRSVMTREDPTKVSGIPFSSLLSTAACASIQSIFHCVPSLASTRYSSFTFSIFPSARSR